MTKPYGLFRYTQVVAGGPGTATVDAFATTDDNGNLLGGNIPDNVSVNAWVAVRSYGSAIIAGPRLSLNPTTSGGLLTALNVVLTNDNGTVGNNIGLYLYIAVTNAANMAL